MQHNKIIQLPSVLLSQLKKGVEHQRQKQRMSAMDKILEITADASPVSKKVLKQARMEGRL